MSKIITFNDLILLAYNEIPKGEESFLNDAVKSEMPIKKDFEEIISMQKVLTMAEDEPSDDVVNKIINYSSALNFLENTSRTKSYFVVVN